MFHRSNSALGIVSKLPLLSLLNYFPFGFGALLLPSGFVFSCENKTEGKGELTASNLDVLLWNHLIKREQMELAHSAERENGGSYSIPSFCQKTVEGCPKKDFQIASGTCHVHPSVPLQRKSVSRW